MSKPDWEMTATTVYCDSVDDEVTIMIYADGTSKCTGRQKYVKPDKETSRAIKKKSQRQGKQLRCIEADCPLLGQYRDNLWK